MDDGVVFGVIIVLGAVWVAVYLIGIGLGFYNRCKRVADMQRRIRELGFDPEDYRL